MPNVELPGREVLTEGLVLAVEPTVSARRERVVRPAARRDGGAAVTGAGAQRPRSSSRSSLEISSALVVP